MNIFKFAWRSYQFWCPEGWDEHVAFFKAFPSAWKNYRRLPPLSAPHAIWQGFDTAHDDRRERRWAYMSTCAN